MDQAVGIPIVKTKEPPTDIVSGSLVREGVAGRPAWTLPAAVTLLVLVCSGVLLPWWVNLYIFWSRDPLRSIGMWFPLVSLLGVLAAWRRLGWALEGTYWGLIPIVVSMPLANFILTRLPYLYLHGHEIGIAKMFSPLFPCAVGAVLLFGGARLLRACWPVLLLLLLLDPVPHAYNQLLDLPLQQLSANTARGFAHMIGVHPSGLQLRMMFTPSFGMMIVPGCDGIRGSVTFAYLALFFGYGRGLRRQTLAVVVLAALFAGFVNNLLRLCLLVVYYRVGMSFAPVQAYGVQVDYAIGCTLFLIAALGLSLVIQALRPHDPAVALPATLTTQSQIRSTLLRAACLIVITLACLATEARAHSTATTKPHTEAEIYAEFPTSVGSYHLVRTYGETYANDSLAFAFGDYERASAGGSAPSQITLGLWVHSRYHQIADSHRTRGQQSIWTGAFNANADLPIHFTNNAFDDGVKLEFDAEAICSEEMCTGVPIRDHFGLAADAAGKTHLGLVHSNRLPIVLQRQMPDGDVAQMPAVRAQFEEDAKAFAKDLNLKPLVAQIGSQD